LGNASSAQTAVTIMCTLQTPILRIWTHPIVTWPAWPLYLPLRARVMSVPLSMELKVTS